MTETDATRMPVWRRCHLYGFFCSCIVCSGARGHPVSRALDGALRAARNFDQVPALWRRARCQLVRH